LNNWGKKIEPPDGIRVESNDPAEIPVEASTSEPDPQTLQSSNTLGVSNDSSSEPSASQSIDAGDYKYRGRKYFGNLNNLFSRAFGSSKMIKSGSIDMKDSSLMTFSKPIWTRIDVARKISSLKNTALFKDRLWFGDRIQSTDDGNVLEESDLTTKYVDRDEIRVKTKRWSIRPLKF
jgi:hypothetical protein